MASKYQVKVFTANLFSTNTYILSDTERKTAIVFDAPGNVNGIVEYLKSIGVERVEAVFLTHGHLDHILAMNELRNKLPGEWKAYLGEPDLKLWRAVNQQLHDFGVPIKIDPIADPEVLLHGGEELKFGDCTIQCILSPGHSEGSIVYYVQRGAETFLVTGDVLFTYSIGRTDWSGIPILRNTSSLADLTKSIRRLEAFPQETPILPGHGGPGKLGTSLETVESMLLCCVCWTNTFLGT